MGKNYRLPWPDWEIAQVLGHGGFGAVYEIRRDVFGKTEQAAVKMISVPRDQDEVNQLRAEGYDDASITAHFRNTLREIVQEYSVMLDVKGHSNVVCCDDLRYVPQESGIGWDIFIKMELLTPLSKAINQGYREEDVVRLGLDMCNALVLCRHQNIIHRDIKPANIFISKSGDYKLGDFGVAKVSDKTTMGTRVGTFDYMAPEIYNSQPYGPASDIYSLGLVLYWLLNDRRTPFLPLPPQIPTGTEKEAACRRRLAGEHLPLPVHGSPELKRIVMKACAYYPRDRYATAEELHADLEKLKSGNPVILGSGGFIPQERTPSFRPSGGNTPYSHRTAPVTPQPVTYQPAPTPPVQAVPPVHMAPPPVQVAPPPVTVVNPPIVEPPRAKKKKSALPSILVCLLLVALVGVGIAYAMGAFEPAPDIEDGWYGTGGDAYYYVNGEKALGWWTINGEDCYFMPDGRYVEHLNTQSVVGYSDSLDRVDIEIDAETNWTCSYLELNRPARDCVQLTYQMEVLEVLQGSYTGTWTLYVRDLEGYWIPVADFEMTDTYFTEDFFWDDPISFDAVTCVYTDTPAVCELDNYQHISNVVTIP